MHASKSMSKSPKQLSCAQRLIMRNILGHRPPAGTVPHAAIVLRTAGGELLRSAQARGPASQPAGLLWHHSQGTLNVARRPIAWDWNW